ncbi:MAG: siderophore-interacting protein [Pseudomonadota bacterium]
MKQHGALIAGRGADLLDPLAQIAERAGFPVRRAGDTMQIDAPLGRAGFTPEADGTRLVLEAKTAAELQLFTDLYAQRLGKVHPGLTVVWDKSAGRQPLNQVIARLSGKTRLSPNFTRLRLEGDFAAFTPQAGLHFRLLIPPAAGGWPERDEAGLTRWPGGVESWHRPPYTVRRIAPDRSWIDVDIVLHSGGRVTDWCAALKPGAEVGLHGPSGSKQPEAPWLGLFGDETALPVIARILEDAPRETEGHALIALRDPADAQDIAAPPGVTVAWADMADDRALLDGAAALAPPGSAHHIFFAAERSLASQARELFKSRGDTAARAVSYWTRPT